MVCGYESWHTHCTVCLGFKVNFLWHSENWRSDLYNYLALWLISYWNEQCSPLPISIMKLQHSRLVGACLLSVSGRASCNTYIFLLFRRFFFHLTLLQLFHFTNSLLLQILNLLMRADLLYKISCSGPLIGLSDWLYKALWFLTAPF